MLAGSHRNTNSVLDASVPAFYKLCSIAETRAVAGLQRFRNTKNTKNTGFQADTDHASLTLLKLTLTTFPAARLSRWSAYHCIITRRCSR